MEHGTVSILGGDAHALPLADAGFDRARVDRVTSTCSTRRAP
jgi:hypothetical protein